MKKKEYEELLEPLKLELNNIAHWLRKTGGRMVIVVEGRDTAGKGGSIGAIADDLNSRQVRIAALPKPSERERTQWYFQRYVAQLPAAGEMVLFDRSWYNRAGVEHVMGYCSKDEYKRFLEQAPIFERMLVDDGVLLYKYWLAVDQVHQEERFAERSSDPLKRWKLSPVDLKAREHYQDYGHARDAMFKATHTKYAPWYVVNFNDQRRGRLNMIQHLVDHIPDPRMRDVSVRLTPLRGKLRRERFRGPVSPIKGRY